jgi:hypothetical protein
MHAAQPTSAPTLCSSVLPITRPRLSWLWLLWKGNIKLGGACGVWLNREERKDLWGSNCFLLLDLRRWDLLLECLICSITLRLCTVAGNHERAVSRLLAVNLITEPPGCGAGLPIHRARSDGGEVRWGAEEQGLHPDGEHCCGPSRQWPRTTLRSAFFWMHELWTTYFLDVSIVGKRCFEFCVSMASITWHRRRSCHTSFGG